MVNLVRKRVEKSVYICIYTSVYIDVVACVEPTQPVPNNVPNELFIKVQSGGSRGCVIVHTGGTPPVPPQNRGNSSASRLGENPNRVYPEGPGKLGTPQKWCFGGANWCKFVQICANLCNLGGPENPGK